MAQNKCFWLQLPHDFFMSNGAYYPDEKEIIWEVFKALAIPMMGLNWTVGRMKYVEKHPDLKRKLKKIQKKLLRSGYLREVVGTE